MLAARHDDRSALRQQLVDEGAVASLLARAGDREGAIRTAREAVSGAERFVAGRADSDLAYVPRSLDWFGAVYEDLSDWRDAAATYQKELPPGKPSIPNWFRIRQRHRKGGGRSQALRKSVGLELTARLLFSVLRYAASRLRIPRYRFAYLARPRAHDILNCLRSHRFGSILGVSLLLAGVVSAQTLFNKPVKVFGDPNFIGTAANPLAFDSFGPNVVEGRELSQPFGIAVDNSSSPPIIYIADTVNNRVLAYQYNTQLTPGAVADLVLGQPDRFTTLPQGPERRPVFHRFEQPHRPRGRQRRESLRSRQRK